MPKKNGRPHMAEWPCFSAGTIRIQSQLALKWFFCCSELELHQSPTTLPPQTINKDDDSSDGDEDGSYHRRHQPPANQTSRSQKPAAHRARGGSPFGRSRHTTPHASQRKKGPPAASAAAVELPGRPPPAKQPPAAKQPPPSPLDAGYQTLEHSYDGESSLSSLDGQSCGRGGRREESDGRLWRGKSGRADEIPAGSRTRDGQSQTALSRPARLEPGVSRHIRCVTVKYP
jgi:hypothetical protein